MMMIDSQVESHVSGRSIIPLSFSLTIDLLWMFEPLTDLQLAAASNEELLAGYKALRQEFTRARQQLTDFHSHISAGWPGDETEIDPISPASEPDKLLHKLRRSVRVVCVPRFYRSDALLSGLTAKALLRVREVSYFSNLLALTDCRKYLGFVALYSRSYPTRSVYRRSDLSTKMVSCSPLAFTIWPLVSTAYSVLNLSDRLERMQFFLEGSVLHRKDARETPDHDDDRCPLGGCTKERDDPVVLGFIRFIIYLMDSGQV